MWHKTILVYVETKQMWAKNENSRKQQKKNMKFPGDRVSALELHQVKLMDELYGTKKYELIGDHRRYAKILDLWSISILYILD